MVNKRWNPPLQYNMPRLRGVMQHQEEIPLPHANRHRFGHDLVQRPVADSRRERLVGKGPADASRSDSRHATEREQRKHAARNRGTGQGDLARNQGSLSDRRSGGRRRSART